MNRLLDVPGLKDSRLKVLLRAYHLAKKNHSVEKEHFYPF